ncbi:dapper homolog 3-like [Falco biarmicus]|uniref:dapper homolog 3-like n=1 Tax=Falco biarmicus TaxID=345155 RepID=UPI0024BCD576|nr:dapper homolog 3-like [Falco biarmicus]
MRRSEELVPPAGSGSPSCPDLLRNVGGPHSPLYYSFFEEECRAIATRLLVGATVAAEPSQSPGEASVLRLGAAAPATSTPLRASPPLDEGAPASAPSADASEAGAACEEPPCLPQPRPGPARPRRAARRGAGQSPCAPRPAGRPPARSQGRGDARVSVSRGSLALELPKAGKGLGAPETRLPQPSGEPGRGRLPRAAAAPRCAPLSPAGTRPKLASAAKSRLRCPGWASQLAQRAALPKAARCAADTETAVKVEGRRQPSQRLATAIPTVASHARLRTLGKEASPKCSCLDKGSTTQELICNRTQELEENGKVDQTWVCVESSLFSELAPGPTPGCGDAVPAEQSAGDQLSQELKRVKNELEQVKGELADKTAQCEAYCRTISSLQAQLRAAGICLEDAAVEECGDSGRD